MLEDATASNLIPLANFATSVYGDDPCECFKIHYTPNEYNTNDLAWDLRIQKAISVIMFKLEGQIIHENPEFEMEDELFLDKLDLEKGTVKIRGKRLCPSRQQLPHRGPEGPLCPDARGGGGHGAASVRLPEMRKTPAPCTFFCIQTAVCTKYTMEIFSITAVYL